MIIILIVLIVIILIILIVIDHAHQSMTTTCVSSVLITCPLDTSCSSRSTASALSAFSITCPGVSASAVSSRYTSISRQEQA
jgi:hypothetical protein